MKYLAIMSLLLLMPFTTGNYAIAEEKNQSPAESTPTAKQEKTGSDLEKKKNKLEEDAGELVKNFKDIFKDLSGISKAVLLPFIDNVSDWIKNNYAELSQESRKKLKNSLEELKKQMNNLEGRSREKTKELFQDFQELLDSLKNKKERKTHPELVPA